MSDEVGLWGAEVSVGERVRVLQPGDHYRYNGDAQIIRLAPNMELVVTRVYNESVIVRTVEPQLLRTLNGTRLRSVASVLVRLTLLTYWDPGAPRPRRLGVTPEGDHIAISDPRVQWIWDDLARYADGMGWCDQYDRLCAKIGIPGRMRSFTAKVTVASGLVVNATVKARSQEEADAMLADAVHATDKQGPDFAPAA